MENKRFGETAVGLGFASSQQVDEALAQQRQRLQHDGDRVLIGFLMVKAGTLTAHQLLEILNQTSKSGQLISEDAILLATRLEAALSEEDKIIMICGAKQEEGVSTIATQLAIAFALMARGQILIMDANLRSPVQYSSLGVEMQPGLTEYIAGDEPFDTVVQTTDLPRLSLLASGGTSGDVLSVLLSEKYVGLMHALREKFHRVIIDAPPINDHPDATVIASHADGVILSIREGERSRDEIRDIMRVLDGLNVNVIGSVLAHA